MTDTGDVLEAIDDVLTDWRGSADSMRWRPSVLEEIERKEREELAAIARLIAEHAGTTLDDAFAAVADVNKHGTDCPGWALCFEVMRTALAPYIAPVLAKVPPEAHDEALRRLTPSMLSAFKQIATHKAGSATHSPR